MTARATLLMLRRASLRLFLLSCITPFICTLRAQDASATWEWGVPRVGSMGILGDLSWDYPLPPMRFPTGEQINLQAVLTRAEASTGLTGYLWSVPQLTTFVAPRQKSRWAWRAPDGREWVFQPPYSTAGSSVSLSSDGTGNVYSPDGWCFHYSKGSLSRLVTPRGFMARIQAQGPLIQRIEFGPLTRPTVLLNAQYSERTGGIQQVDISGRSIIFLSSSAGEAMALLDSGGAKLVEISYANGLPAAIKPRGAAESVLQWKELGYLDSTLRRRVGRGSVLKGFGNQSYRLTLRQGSTTGEMRVGELFWRMTLNHYNNQITYSP